MELGEKGDRKSVGNWGFRLPKEAFVWRAALGLSCCFIIFFKAVYKNGFSLEQVMQRPGNWKQNKFAGRAQVKHTAKKAGLKVSEFGHKIWISTRPRKDIIYRAHLKMHLR